MAGLRRNPDLRRHMCRRDAGGARSLHWALVNDAGRAARGARALEMDDPGPLRPRKTSTGMDVMVGATGIEPVTPTMSRASSAPSHATPRHAKGAHGHRFYGHIPPYCSMPNHTKQTKGGAFGVPSG